MTRHHKLAAVSLGTICALVGATAGIAESSAKVQHPAGSGWGRLVGPMFGGGPGLGGFGVIHAVSIRQTTKGGFDTVTTDAGTITAAGRTPSRSKRDQRRQPTPRRRSHPRAT